MWLRNKSVVGFLLLLLLVGITFALVQYKKSHNVTNSSVESSIKGENDATSGGNAVEAKQTTIPEKVFNVLRYVRANKKAPKGYVGGREFKNRERKLAIRTSAGRKIYYQEWDVNPKKAGVNRGAERLITGDDNRAWYTKNHYKTFVEVVDK